MKKFSTSLVWMVLLAGTILSCSTEDGGTDAPQDNFDRAAMLTSWADDYIIPAHEAHQLTLNTLKTANNAFIAAPNVANYETLRQAFVNCYISWQWVSFLDIGPAEAATLRNYTNIYPLDASGMLQTLSNPPYLLNLPSKFSQQGFPAIDYLLHGLGDANATIAQFKNDPNYGSYLMAVVDRMDMLHSDVLNQWKAGYRETFINASGSSATASVNKLTNDFIFHYEKELRAGKIGIPAGVFSGNILPGTVESFYADTLSKRLFLAGLEAHRSFFAGDGYAANYTGTSLKNYLDYLGTMHKGELLSKAILDQFEVAKQSAQKLPTSFAQGVQNQHLDMLATYDELQKNVILLKVDMLQALNIKVDYVDADGD